MEPDLTLAVDPPRRGPRDSSSEVKLDVSTVSLGDGQNFFVPYVYLLVRWHLRELLDPEVYQDPGCQVESRSEAGELGLLGFLPESCQVSISKECKQLQYTCAEIKLPT